MKIKEKITIPKYTLGEEITNAIIHGIGILLSITALVLCVIFSTFHGNVYAIVSSAIYGATLIILYTASCLYHSLKINNAKRIFRIIDHCSIYLLIAGTYTPYTLVTLNGSIGWLTFSIIWLTALLGIVLNALNLVKYKRISMFLYFAMGWLIIFSFKYLLVNISRPGLYLLLSGGIVYTIGTIFYGLGRTKKYMHSIFHIFVLIASVLQFFSIFFYVI